MPDWYEQHHKLMDQAERERIDCELQRLRKERDDARNEVRAAELRGELAERARIERIIASMPWSGATRAEALAAIRGGDDAARG